MPRKAGEWTTSQYLYGSYLWAIQSCSRRALRDLENLRASVARGDDAEEDSTRLLDSSSASSSYTEPTAMAVTAAEALNPGRDPVSLGAWYERHLVTASRILDELRDDTDMDEDLPYWKKALPYMIVFAIIFWPVFFTFSVQNGNPSVQFDFDAAFWRAMNSAVINLAIVTKEGTKSASEFVQFLIDSYHGKTDFARDGISWKNLLRVGLILLAINSATATSSVYLGGAECAIESAGAPYGPAEEGSNYAGWAVMAWIYLPDILEWLLSFPRRAGMSMAGLDIEGRAKEWADRTQRTLDFGNTEDMTTETMELNRVAALSISDLLKEIAKPTPTRTIAQWAWDGLPLTVGAVCATLVWYAQSRLILTAMNKIPEEIGYSPLFLLLLARVPGIGPIFNLFLSSPLLFWDSRLTAEGIKDMLYRLAGVFRDDHLAFRIATVLGLGVSGFLTYYSLGAIEGQSTCGVDQARGNATDPVTEAIYWPAQFPVIDDPVNVGTDVDGFAINFGGVFWIIQPLATGIVLACSSCFCCFPKAEVSDREEAKKGLESAGKALTKKLEGALLLADPKIQKQITEAADRAAWGHP